MTFLESYKKGALPNRWDLYPWHGYYRDSSSVRTVQPPPVHASNQSASTFEQRTTVSHCQSGKLRQLSSNIYTLSMISGYENRQNYPRKFKLLLDSLLLSNKEFPGQIQKCNYSRTTYACDNKIHEEPTPSVRTKTTRNSSPILPQKLLGFRLLNSQRVALGGDHRNTIRITTARAQTLANSGQK